MVIYQGFAFIGLGWWSIAAGQSRHGEGYSNRWHWRMFSRLRIPM